MLTTKTFATPLKRDYGENDQINPIRWCLYHYDADKEEFTAQSDWFKCKDFFNDVVAKYNGIEGKVYGFDTKPLLLNMYGVWIRLKHLKKAFYHNALLVAEKFQVTLNFAPFEDDETQCLTLFPRELFENTYKISLFTLLIRAANESTKYDSYEELIEKSSEPLLGNSRFKRAPLTLPEELQPYWCYMGERWNSQKWGSAAGPVPAVQGRSAPNIEAVHNNGFMSWMDSAPGVFQ